MLVGSASSTFEAQSRGLQALGVRFAAGVAPAPRNTPFRLVANLGRVRIRTFWVANKVPVTSLSSPFFLLHQALRGAISPLGSVPTQERLSKTS